MDSIGAAAYVVAGNAVALIVALVLSIVFGGWAFQTAGRRRSLSIWPFLPAIANLGIAFAMEVAWYMTARLLRHGAFGEALTAVNLWEEYWATAMLRLYLALSLFIFLPICWHIMYADWEVAWRKAGALASCLAVLYLVLISVWR